jgi:hypothetical protein
MSLYKRHVHCVRRTGLSLTPKYHLTLHMIWRICPNAESHESNGFGNGPQERIGPVSIFSLFERFGINYMGPPKFYTSFLEESYNVVTVSIRLSYFYLFERFGIKYMGSPKFYSTFLDESYNGKLAKICAACHRSTWEKTAFAKFGRRYGFKSQTVKTTHKFRRRRLR